jgi:hypothetical protein
MWTLDKIVALLKKRHQRATYGAVAGVLNRAAMGLMKGRPRSRQDSWVVAQGNRRGRGARRGWPTGYSDDEIDPVCLAQIHKDPGDFIGDPVELDKWLNARR